MGVGAGLYMCDLVKKFTFAISSPDEFLLHIDTMKMWNKLGAKESVLCLPVT